MGLFNELQCWFSINVYAKYENHKKNGKYFLIYCINGSFLMSIAKKCIITSPKIEFSDNQKTWVD